MVKANPGGFTLIELLVVVAIIALLLSLLMPAMDKAIYQAELVQCGARQRGIANASIHYAFDHNRRYPDRRDPAWKLNSLILQVGGEASMAQNNWDLRPAFYPNYLPSFAFFVDPVTNAIDVSYEANSPDCQIFSDYHINTAWGPGGTNRMMKMGQGFTWTENGVTKEIHVLVSDKNEVRPGPPLEAAGSNHPDDLGLLTFSSRQNAENPTQSPDSRATDLYPKKTIGGYAGSRERGGLSVNYAYDDGSVRRYDHVTLNDDRMFGVPHENPNPGPTQPLAKTGDLRRTLVPAGN